MTPKKKIAASSTDSSSGSSSSSSGSSSSSSSSGSSSSSSDSESSSSQEPTKAPSVPANKKQTARRSTDAAPLKSAPIATKGEVNNIHNNKPKPPQKAPVKAKNNIYSSEDDLPSKSTSITKSNTAKRKPAPAKPKTSATVTPKPIAKSTKHTTTGKSTNTSKSLTKSNEKTSEKLSVLHYSQKSKKKSIFSPDNSSESEDISSKKITPVKDNSSETDDEKTNKTTASSRVPAKAPPTVIKGKTKPPAKQKILNTKTKPPSKIKITDKPPKTRRNSDKNSYKSKAFISSASSTSSISSDSSSSSDNETSANSTPTDKKQTKKVSAKPTTTAKIENRDLIISESDDSKPASSITRKLTRSSSTRKSKHLIGKAASDTESDGDSTKRSLSKSPVKRAPTVAKAKGKNKRHDNKISRVAEALPMLEERKCPLEGCDSNGHLGGQAEKHFTVEACPLYHNVSVENCKHMIHERQKHQEMRTKAIAAYDKEKKVQSIDQRQYLLKVKEQRIKFKTEVQHTSSSDKEHEPSLDGVAPEYDLKLFREAQAMASEAIEEELKGLPASRGTRYVSMGKYCMEVWYQSPYPEDAARLPKLFLCEFCLRYQKSSVGMKRHAAKCVWRHPPGEEVYRKSKLGVWQVDGKRHKQYCQHLCLLAKFFLDHKTLYYDVEPFLFYVMTLADNEGCHTVGYFSKEKNSFLNYNVSCILTLPPYQRQGYGRLLIDFSYLLTRTEGKIGSPEKPLSDLGLISYRSYWKDVLLAYLCARPGTTLSVKDVSQEMAINSYDIVSTLQALGMMKYWKGKHIILKKQDVLDEYVDRVKRRGAVREIDPACLRWSPFVPPAPPSPS